MTKWINIDDETNEDTIETYRVTFKTDAREFEDILEVIGRDIIVKCERAAWKRVAKCN